MNLISADAEIQVAFYDLDPMDVVWHGNYVKYLEVARAALLAKVDYGYEKMKLSGYSWPVVDLRLRYVKPAKLGQKLICTARIVDYENRLKIAYEITCAKTGERVTKGYSVQVAVDVNTQEMQFVSPKVMQDKMRAMHENG